MKYNIGDRIRFKNSKNSNEIYKVLEYNEEEGYKTRLERVGATVIIPNWQIEYTELVNEQVSEQVSKSEDSSVNSSVKKLKLIDILNKIANGELKEGTKVKWDVFEYTYREDEFKDECLERKDSDNKTIDILEDMYLRHLDSEVELIEPECISNEGKTSEVTDNTKIEELKYVLEELQNPTYNESWLMNCIRANRDKLNEVIRYINKGAEK